MRHLTAFLAAGVLIVCVTASVWSSEADELRAKAKAVHQEAEKLAKEGRKEEAEKLVRHAQELLQAAEKHQSKGPKDADYEIDQLRQQLKNLFAKEEALRDSKNEAGLNELRKHRADVERELKAIHERRAQKQPSKHGDKQPSKSPPEGLEEDARRLKHLHVAVENLHAAGMHDVAEELAKRAENMQRELHHAQRPDFLKETKSSAVREKPKHGDRPMHNPERSKRPLERKFKSAPTSLPVNELREELQRLRDEVNELREEIKKRP